MITNFVHEYIEGIRIALSALRDNKLRTILTTSGIVIGIVAVTLMATAIEGLNRAFTSSISALGSDVLYVQKYPWFSNDRFKYKNRKNLKLSDADFIKKYSTYAEYVAPVIMSHKTIKHREKSIERVLLIGTEVSYRETSGSYPEYGRFLSETDVHHSRYTAVIGSEVADKLFENENPMGKKIKIGGKPFKIIGILEEKGSFLGMMDLDNRIIIPVGTFQNSFGTRRSPSIEVKMKDPDTIEEAKDELIGIMRRSRKLSASLDDDFSINQQSLFSDMYAKMTGAIYAAGIIITSLSLLVGGIGVMNIMLVSVTERTKEIGIRKALGAKRRNIMVQFLIESASICISGGIIALIIGFVLSIIINEFLLPTAMPLTWALIAILISAVIGIGFGLYPAAKASKLDPIDALRYE